MERVRTMRIANWNAEDVDEDEHDRFFASCSSSSSSDNEHDSFDDCRLSFASAVSSHRVSSASPTDLTLYDVWIATPTSISERRKRLFQGMGLATESSVGTSVVVETPTPSPSPSPSPSGRRTAGQQVVRSRSEGDIESLCIEKQRRIEMVGSKQVMFTRTHSGTTLLKDSNASPAALFLIKNLDTGNEFMVKECAKDGTWNRLSDLQTGKQLTMEEFEKCVGHSPVVKELMRRQHKKPVTIINNINITNYNSYIYKSLRRSKRRGVALIKSGIKSVSGFIYENQHQEHQQQDQSRWIKARQTGKAEKELTALHLCHEIEAHQGSIWSIKFSRDARFLASAGEDRVVRVWEVEECQVTDDSPAPPNIKKMASARKSTPDYVHVPHTVFGLSDKPVCSFHGHSDHVLDLSWSTSQLLLSSSMDKSVRLWDLETKTCLKLFAHNDYVTCIDFNPKNEEYFISGSLDGKVRIWSIPERQVVDWTDFHEMVTAASYTPDGQGAFIGSNKGNIRVYTIQAGKLSQTAQIDLQNKKKSQAKKITGFQFSPKKASQVVVTSADSRVRILDGQNVVEKFKGFRNTSSQIAASFSEDAKYVISASEDSQVYLWRREESHRHNNSSSSNSNNNNKKNTVINTSSFEHFQCADVSTAVPWPVRSSAAWGLVVVTAGLGGHIRAYQNFGLPRKVGRQTSLFT